LTLFEPNGELDARAFEAALEASFPAGSLQLGGIHRLLVCRLVL
jgi:hypothetical protein